MFTDSTMMMLITLLGAHAFFDYAGQGDFMSKAKNQTVPIPGVPYWNVLAAHATIHGAAVAIITGVWWLFIFEAVSHFITDNEKCKGKISFNTDQAIHVGLKFCWWIMVIVVMK